jgi:hypothetical protein
MIRNDLKKVKTPYNLSFNCFTYEKNKMYVSMAFGKKMGCCSRTDLSWRWGQEIRKAEANGFGLGERKD